MTTPPENSSSGNTASTRPAVPWGKLLVILLCLAVTIWYVHHVRQRQTAPSPATTSTAFDATAAQAQVQALGQKVSHAMTTGLLGPAMEQEARALADRFPRFAPARTLLAQVLWSRQQVPAAYEQLSLGLGLDPKQAAVQEMAGTLALELGKPDEAGTHFSRAMDLDPKEPRYRLDLANVYLRQREFDRAERLFLEALQIDSNLHAAYAGLSDLFAQQNKLVMALDQVQHAIDHTPVSERARQVIYLRKKANLLRRANRPAEALQVLNMLTDGERRDPAVLAELATTHTMLGKPADAAELYHRAWEKSPTQWELAAEAARYYQRAGNTLAAGQMLEQVRQVNPQASVLTDPGQAREAAAGATTAP
ncbi:MAG: tetratricopeptide repeat protein [Phycisphaeraceae bacterium]|nr:tetratricopeptide repeat protein [Phycisphaeraceae bacterium]